MKFWPFTLKIFSQLLDKIKLFCKQRKIIKIKFRSIWSILKAFTASRNLDIYKNNVLFRKAPLEGSASDLWIQFIWLLLLFFSYVSNLEKLFITWRNCILYVAKKNTLDESTLFIICGNSITTAISFRPETSKGRAGCFILRGNIGNKLHTTSSAQWLRTQSHLKRVFTCVFSYIPDALKWIWNIPSPDKWAELLLGVLSENRLLSPIHEIKTF